MNKINYSIPATITSFKEGNNPLLTYCKLKVFYIGETADKRLFTKEFSDKLMKTLPQVPVVARYDDSQEDFSGHDQTQYVYGYVPETTNLEFVEEDGKTYAVTDIVLFTGRNDNIGEVAKKIPGKSQSLELDPNTIKYTINKDSQGKFKNMEFTDGAITGLSVLGDDQNPAFSGSEFFTEMSEEQLVAAFVSLFDKVETKSQEDDGGVQMDKFLEFIKKTHSEEYNELYDAFKKSDLCGDWAAIVQSDDSTIVYYTWTDEGVKYYRANYTRSEEDAIEFSDAVEVKARYLTEDEIDSTFEAVVEPKVDPEFKEEDNKEEDNEDEDKEDFVEEEDDKETDSDDEDKKDYRKDDEDKSKCSISTEEFEALQAKLDEANAALNVYKRADKEAVITKYTELMTEEQTTEFNAKLDTLSADELEKELKIATYEAAIAKATAPIVEEEETAVFTSTVIKKKKSNLSTEEQLIAKYIK